MRWLAKVGFATKGIVYFLMGSLALLAAAGQRGGQIGDKQRSVHSLVALPGGRVLLAVIAIGLLAYVLVRVMQGLFDTEQKGTRFKGIARRIGYVVNGVLYLGLVAYASTSAFGGRVATDSRENERTWTARVLHWPGGVWLVMLVGVIIVIAGLVAMSQAYTGKFMETIELDDVGEKRYAFIRRAGQAGYLARGVVMVIIGSFFFHAGKTARAAAVGNAEDALDLLAKMGPLVLAAVAFGLASYGVFAMLQALYPVRR